MMENDELLSAVEPILGIPKVVFIVPYRDREQQKQFYERQMKFVMEDFPPDFYRIFFVHQRYEGSFNRGGMKNAGFLAVVDMFPDDWETITFVFNDVDCMPYTKNFLPYETTYGIAKHFYGFTHTLGGIVSITGKTFAESGGFPMFHAYGYEDNLLQQRVLKAGFRIDRSVFFTLYDRNILSFRDGVIRKVNRKEFDEYLLGKVTEGLHSVVELKYVFEDEYIHIDKLNFGRNEDVSATKDYDLRNGNVPFANPLEALQQENKHKRVGMMRVLAGGGGASPTPERTNTTTTTTFASSASSAKFAQTKPVGSSSVVPSPLFSMVFHSPVTVPTAAARRKEATTPRKLLSTVTSTKKRNTNDGVFIMSRK